MACFLCIVWSTDQQFYATHCAEVPLITCCNSNGVNQIVVSKNSEFCEFIIKELHVIPLAGHLGIQKLTHAFFQKVGQAV